MKLTRWLVLAALCSGCDGAASTDYHQRFASLGGNIVSSSLPAVAPRAAIVWRAVAINLAALVGRLLGAPVDGEAVRIHTSPADVPVAATFPSSYRIDIDELPPPEAVLDLTQARLGLSLGAITFYDDVDGDQRLDLDHAGAIGADRVLGSADLMIVYLENHDRSVPTGDPDPTGFHLARAQPLPVPPACGEMAPAPPAMPLLPIDTAVDVALGDGALPASLCYAPISPAGSCMPEPGDHVTCNADGSGWRVTPPIVVGGCPTRAPCTTRLPCPAPMQRPAFCDQ